MRLTGQILALAGHLLPTPRATEGSNGGPNQRGSSGDLTLSSATVRMLPTPRTSDTNGSGAHGTGGLDLRTAVTLLPTPKAADGEFGLPRTSGRPPEMSTHLATRLRYTDFGDYASAIRRWEQVTGHPAPPPTEPTGRGGAQRLSAKFAEWMMGLTPGWVTGILISRTEQLRAIGNGVVPQQAVAALVDMKQHFEPRPVRGSSMLKED